MLCLLYLISKPCHGCPLVALDILFASLETPFTLAPTRGLYIGASARECAGRGGVKRGRGERMLVCMYDKQLNALAGTGVDMQPRPRLLGLAQFFKLAL